MRNSSFFRTPLRVVSLVFLCLLFMALRALPANASIDVTNSYVPATLYLDQVSTLTIKLQNTQLVSSANVSLADMFPAGTFVAAMPNVITNCGGPTTNESITNNASVSAALVSMGVCRSIISINQV